MTTRPTFHQVVQDCGNNIDLLNAFLANGPAQSEIKCLLDLSWRHSDHFKRLVEALAPQPHSLDNMLETVSKRDTPDAADTLAFILVTRARYAPPIHSNELIARLLKPALKLRDIEKVNVLMSHIAPERLKSASFKGLLWACETCFEPAVISLLRSPPTYPQANRALSWLIDNHPPNSESMIRLIAPHANTYKLFKGYLKSGHVVPANTITRHASPSMLKTMLSIPGLDVTQFPRLQAHALEDSMGNAVPSKAHLPARPRL